MQIFGPYTVQVPQFLNVEVMFTTLEFQLCKYAAHLKWGDVRIGCELPLRYTLILKSREDSEENEEAGVEDWRKLI